MKILLTLFLSFLSVKAQDIKLYLTSNTINNGQTALLFLDSKEEISNVKLTFDKHNIKLLKNPKKNKSFYALIPISYYKTKGKYRVIVSYVKNSKKIFKGLDLKVIDGKYKSEVINVPKGKVFLSKKHKKRVQKEYKEAMKVYNKVSENLYFDGAFIKPLNTKITSSFGKKRLYNNKLQSYHSGTDFRALKPSKIKASNSGIVVIAQDRFYAGNSIVIDHGHGIYSCYFHLSKMNFKVGDSIKKGDILGLSGSTGRVTGPHLHFAFKIHGITVDPLHALEILNNHLIY